jgi:hypothetical protein
VRVPVRATRSTLPTGHRTIACASKEKRGRRVVRLLARCSLSSDSAASGRARRCARSAPLPRSRSLAPALLGRRPQRARGDASSRRSLSQSEQQPTAILRTVPAWSRAAARNGCGVRDLGPCGGSGPSPSPDLAIAHRVGLARAGARRGHRLPRAGPGPQASAATSRRRPDRQARTSPPGQSLPGRVQRPHLADPQRRWGGRRLRGGGASQFRATWPSPLEGYGFTRLTSSASSRSNRSGASQKGMCPMSSYHDTAAVPQRLSTCSDMEGSAIASSRP